MCNIILGSAVVKLASFCCCCHCILPLLPLLPPLPLLPLASSHPASLVVATVPVAIAVVDAAIFALLDPHVQLLMSHWLVLRVEVVLLHPPSLLLSIILNSIVFCVGVG